MTAFTATASNPGLGLPCAQLRMALPRVERASLRDRIAAELPALPARTVQHLLVALGRLAPDAVSGRFDRATAGAVSGFQDCAGLLVTGIPDRTTADALLHAAG